MVKDCKAMCAKGGFNLTKFVSNRREVIESVPVEDRAKGLREVDLEKDDLPVERTLGVEWSVEEDVLQFRLDLKPKALTRRGILSTVASIYDNLGFVAPLVLQGKWILQELCRENRDWDVALPRHLEEEWIKWVQDLSALETVRIPRCLKPVGFGEVGKIEFHHFADASERGYGMCSYARFENRAGDVHVSFLIGKSRVARLKAISIPRLELTAATIAVQLSLVIKEEFEFQDVNEFFWTDSKVVLGYITNDSRRFHTFVANRVSTILDHTMPEQWHHVRSEFNPADDASRSLSATEMVSGSRWLNGPGFLRGDPFWREAHVEKVELDEEDPEVRKTSVTLSTACKVVFPSLADRLTRFSSWFKAKRAIALAILYVRRLRKSAAKQEKPVVALSVDILHEAEIVILLEAQREFREEILVISSGGQLRPGNRLGKLSPMLDKQGLLQVRGRLEHASISAEEKHPIILSHPRDGHISRLILRECHEKVSHGGRGLTLGELRTRGFYMLGGTTAVSSLIHDCVVCRKLRGTLQTQRMADLPSDRVNQAGPFEYAGVDYFGPFLVKQGRARVKKYGVLFVCLNSRAIHLEVASSLDASSFINAYRRFVCVRGPCRQLRSDQGTNFIGANNELRKALSELDSTAVADHLLRNDCDFVEVKVNTPSSSHRGGIWERQIGSVRRILESMMVTHPGQLDDEALRTFMCEVMSILNSRPIAIESLNDSDGFVPLTPNHILTMKGRILLAPPGDHSVGQYTLSMWRRVQHLTNEFYARFRKEFLQSLQERPKWNRIERNLGVGDVVIVKDGSSDRNKWSLGRIEEVLPSEDGLVRTVRVRMADSDRVDVKGRHTKVMTVLERPVQKLVLLLRNDG